MDNPPKVILGKVFSRVLAAHTTQGTAFNFVALPYWPNKYWVSFKRQYYHKCKPELCFPVFLCVK